MPDVGSAVGGGASIIGGLIGGGSADDAVAAQTAAADRSIQFQREMFEKTQENLKPYMDFGKLALDIFTKNTQDGLTSPLLKPVVMDQTTLETTPGYQFNLAQGLRAVQNSAAARGLGASGAALKGAAQYATGLADNTYQNQFNNAVTNQTNQFNRLLAMSGIGQSSAANLGNIGQQTAANIGSTYLGAGNAQGAAAIAQGNAWNNAFQTAGMYGAMRAQSNPNSFWNRSLF